MQPLAEQTMRDAAIAWHLRLTDGSDADWGGFADWLEADPRHNDIYEAVCDADLALEPAVEIAREAPAEVEVDPFPEMAQLRPARRWMWPAMAASVAFAALGTWAGSGLLSSDYSVRTAPGETRTFALSDGTRIVLNGGRSSPLVMTPRGPSRCRSVTSASSMWAPYSTCAVARTCCGSKWPKARCASRTV